MKDTAL